MAKLSRWSSHLSAGDSRIATLHRWTKDDLALEVDVVTDIRLMYPLSDHLGSVAIELNDNAELVSLEEHFVYGGTAFVLGDAAREVNLREYRYSGKLRDSFTGFYAYDYRELIPWLGNWLSPDPAGDVDGPNRFAFVGGNPVRFVDERGLFGLDTIEPDLGKYSQYAAGASATTDEGVTVIPRANGTTTLIPNPGPPVYENRYEEFTNGDSIHVPRSDENASADTSTTATQESPNPGSAQNLMPPAEDEAASDNPLWTPVPESDGPSGTTELDREVERVGEWLESLSESLTPELLNSYRRREYEDRVDVDRTRRRIDRGEQPEAITETNPGSEVRAVDPRRQIDLLPVGERPSRSLLVGIEDETLQESRLAQISPDDIEALRRQWAAADEQFSQDLVVGPHGGPDGRGGIATRDAYAQSEHDANTEAHLRAMQASTSFTGAFFGQAAARFGGDIEDVARSAEMGMAAEIVGLAAAIGPPRIRPVMRNMNQSAFYPRGLGASGCDS